MALALITIGIVFGIILAGTFLAWRFEIRRQARKEFEREQSERINRQLGS